MDKIVRIVSPGWETFTGSMGHQAVFDNGLSVTPLNARQIARIGSTIQIIDEETGLQLGPAEIARQIQSAEVPVIEPVVTQATLDEVEADNVAALLAAEKERKAEEARALAEAEEKAKAAAGSIVVWTRMELEAIGAQDGITGLREIAAPLGVKGRSITEMVDLILDAQAKAETV